jgi:hypothetical protein
MTKECHNYDICVKTNAKTAKNKSMDIVIKFVTDGPRRREDRKLFSKKLIKRIWKREPRVPAAAALTVSAAKLGLMDGCPAKGVGRSSHGISFACYRKVEGTAPARAQGGSTNLIVF